MKHPTMVFLFVCLFILCGCSPSSPGGDSLPLEGKMQGKWRGGREYTFKAGVMALSNGRVYASYQVLDKETIRFRQDSSESPVDYLLIVRFPDPNTMVWYKSRSGQLSQWRSFERIKE